MYWTAILQETPETTRLFVIGMIVIDSQITKIVQLVDDFQVNNQLPFLLTLTPVYPLSYNHCKGIVAPSVMLATKVSNFNEIK